MHAGDCELLEPGTRHAIDFGQHRIERPAFWRSAGRGDDAVRAGLRTAGLNPQRERRSPRDAGFYRRATRTVAVSKPLRRAEALVGAQHERHEPGLLRIRNDLSDMAERSHFRRPSCCVAPGDDDPGFGVMAGKAPDRLTRSLIGAARDRAGVDHDNVGFLGRRGPRAAGQELFLEAERVGLVDAAPECDDRVLHAVIKASVHVQRRCRCSRYRDGTACPRRTPGRRPHRRGPQPQKSSCRGRQRSALSPQL